MNADQLNLLIDLAQTSPGIAVAAVVCIVLYKLYPQFKELLHARAQAVEAREKRKAQESKERSVRDAKYDAFILSIEPILKGFSSVVDNNTEAMKQNKHSIDKLTEKTNEVSDALIRLDSTIESSIAADQRMEAQAARTAETLTKVHTIIDRCHRH